MKKILILATAISLFSCNSNEKNSSQDLLDQKSNLELAKTTLDKIFDNTESYENHENIGAPYGSKLSSQLDSLKTTLSKEQLKEFNDYAQKRFDEEYSQS
ncbi:hypothetical protein GCM10023115_24690 [Pontixanthobacter gangjinensis]|uniref:Uncharacterized protein n=1 Tax=Christiangramia aestuarii TaxID=1028746 RepID=A0A7K1LSZ0_9FLAO|nr:hypothetical protein [Christiangramia aestuarii]MUP43898.1 hypothetical protein [Christiangramia aestuarii]